MRDIPAFEGRYSATEDGHIWSNLRGKWLKPFLVGSKGSQYLAVELNGQTLKVHRIIALTFTPNPANLPQINHKDTDKMNNSASNLEWTTQIGNSQHAENAGLMKRFYGEDHGKHKLSTVEVQEIRRKRALGALIRELAEEFSSSTSNISYICRKETRING